MSEDQGENTRPLSIRQQVFVIEYTGCWNASEAARRAGYSRHTANEQGSRLLTNVSVQQAIRKRLSEIAMPADEVLSRLAQHARGSMGDFIQLDAEGRPAGFNLGPDAPQHLIKKVSIADRGITFELYDAQAALTILARHHGLLLDRSELTGKDGGPIAVKGYLVREASPDAWDDEQPAE